MKLLGPVSGILCSLVMRLRPVSANYRKCIDTVDVSKDYFPDKISPQYSSGWDISYHKTYKILTNKVANTSYLLYQCGTEVPAAEAGKHDLTISVPLQNGIVLTSTTTIPHVQQLGLRRQVKGWLGNPDHISSPCMNTMIEEEAVKVLFDPFSWSTEGQNLTDYLVENPDTVVIRGSNQGQNALVFSESSEEENLDIYEWHKVFGALFNLEQTANKQFEEAEDRFLCNTANAEFIFENDENESEKPTVLWARYSPASLWGPDYWDVASCDAKNHYYCEFADRCASTLLHSNNGTIENAYQADDFHMTDDEFFEFGQDADYFIYTGYNWDFTYEKFKEKLDTFKSVQGEEVYDVLGSGSGSWFEDRIAEFDVVLQDFCEVVGHYDDIESESHERQYFRKVMGDDKEQIGGGEECLAGFVDLPWETRASECVLLEGTDDSDDSDDSENVAPKLASGVSMIVLIIAALL